MVKTGEGMLFKFYPSLCPMSCFLLDSINPFSQGNLPCPDFWKILGECEVKVGRVIVFGKGSEVCPKK